MNDFVCPKCGLSPRNVAGEVFYCPTCGRNYLHRELLIIQSAGSGRLTEFYFQVENEKQSQPPKKDLSLDTNNHE